MKKLENPKYLFSNLSEDVRELNRLLLEVSWESVDFDNPVFKEGITSGNEDLNEEQNKLIKALVANIPDWERLLGCKQHHTHDYCLDIHTLSVIKKIREFEKFNFLNEYEKLILLYSALLHDIEKLEKEVDPEHPARGSKKASAILFEMGFGEDFINSVYLLIKHHQVLGLLAAGKISFSGEELIEIFKNPSLLNLQMMLSTADIKSVKKNESFMEKDTEKKLEEIFDRIKKLLDDI